MKTHQISSRTPRQQGFTLVEMAIVLVIIGLILGALAVGKDVMRNAEYQKVSNKFLYEWKKSYDGYYQRAGVVLGDSQVAPTNMINGDETTIGGQPASSGNLNGAVAGIPANYANTGLRICNGQGFAKDTVGAGDTNLATQNLRALMQKIGVRMPPGRGEGKEDRYVYTDTNGNPAEIQVCFQWNPPSQTQGAGNVMVIRGLTPDLARFLDQLVDGKPDAQEGRFRQQNIAANTTGTANQPGVQWAANNTYGQNNAAGATATGTGARLDEDQVVWVTAIWVMDQ
jgi:prepilin-type N-terminal cleavage/methylation domain-containing protein